MKVVGLELEVGRAGGLGSGGAAAGGGGGWWHVVNLSPLQGDGDVRARGVGQKRLWRRGVVGKRRTEATATPNNSIIALHPHCGTGIRITIIVRQIMEGVEPTSRPLFRSGAAVLEGREPVRLPPVRQSQNRTVMARAKLPRGELGSTSQR